MASFKICCDEKDFRRVARAFRKELRPKCPLSCEVVFTDEEEIRRLNREIRGVDAVTDVLSFPTLEGIKGVTLRKEGKDSDVDERGRLFLGSVAICTKRAQEQAEEFGHGLEREMNYLAVHGICHLLGYDHMTEEERHEMRDMEERVLKMAGVGPV